MLAALPSRATSATGRDRPQNTPAGVGWRTLTTRSTGLCSKTGAQINISLKKGEEKKKLIKVGDSFKLPAAAAKPKKAAAKPKAAKATKPKVLAASARLSNPPVPSRVCNRG